MSEWSELGVLKVNGEKLPNKNLDAYLVFPEGENGKKYLVYENFKVIMKWNRSLFFGIRLAPFWYDRISLMKYIYLLLILLLSQCAAVNIVPLAIEDSNKNKNISLIEKYIEEPYKLMANGFIQGITNPM